MTVSIVTIKKEKNKYFQLTYGDITFELLLDGNKRVSSIKSIEGDIFYMYEHEYAYGEKDYENFVKEFFDNMQMSLYHEVLNNKDYCHPKYELYKNKLNESIYILAPMFVLGKYVLEYDFLYILSNKEKAVFLIQNVITNEFFLFEYFYDRKDYESKYTSYSLYDLINRIKNHKERDEFFEKVMLYFI